MSARQGGHATYRNQTSAVDAVDAAIWLWASSNMFIYPSPQKFLEISLSSDAQQRF